MKVKLGLPESDVLFVSAQVPQIDHSAYGWMQEKV